MKHKFRIQKTVNFSVTGTLASFIFEIITTVPTFIKHILRVWLEDLKEKWSLNFIYSTSEK